MGKGHEQSIHRKNLQITSEHLKRCSASLLKERYNRISIIYPLLHIILPTNKTFNNTIFQDYKKPAIFTHFKSLCNLVLHFEKQFYNIYQS